MYGIVYKTTNLINGKTYIGQTTRSKAYYYGSGTLIIKAIKKYGKNNFEKEILCERETQDSLDHAERLYIALLKPEYNIDLGGKNKGKCSEAHKEKIRKINKGKNPYSNGCSIETRKRMSESGKKKIFSIETRKKMSLKGKGKKHGPPSEKTREKIRNSLLNKETSQTKKVKCIELEKVFISAKQASRYYTIDDSGIIKCCRGKRHTAGGFHWEYYYG
jgi:group I intron endonuclease